MHKVKRRSSAKKRFRKVGGNKIKRSKAFRRHLLTSKSTKRKRRLRKRAYVSSADDRRIAELLR
jgi:large subunit ribosomal protein L35